MNMAPAASPENWTIESTRDGFCLMDVWGEWICDIPGQGPTLFDDWQGACEYRAIAAREYYDNYEPSEAELTASLNLGGESGNARLARQQAEARKLK